jgi:very-short-patch-repair endonuclease
LSTVTVEFVDPNQSSVIEIDEIHPIVALARQQHGVVTAAQLAGLGRSHRWIEGRVARGWLRRLHRGVYLVGPVEAEHTYAMAGVLAIPASTISSYPAAVLWSCRPPREGPIDVIVPRNVRARPGLRVHRTALHPRDITRRHGIPVTSAARTILDVAAEDSREAERALNEAWAARLVSIPSLDEQLRRYPRHRGATALRNLIQRDKGFTRSEAERILRALVRKARLPEPEANVKVEGYEADLAWREQRLIVEFDSWSFHSMRRSFEDDRRRDQRLTVSGWRVLRITWRQLTQEPEAVVAVISAALVRRL